MLTRAKIALFGAVVFSSLIVPAIAQAGIKI